MFALSFLHCQIAATQNQVNSTLHSIQRHNISKSKIKSQITRNKKLWQERNLSNENSQMSNNRNSIRNSQMKSRRSYSVTITTPSKKSFPNGRRAVSEKPCNFEEEDYFNKAHKTAEQIMHEQAFGIERHECKSQDINDDGIGTEESDQLVIMHKSKIYHSSATEEKDIDTEEEKEGMNKNHLLKQKILTKKHSNNNLFVSDEVCRSSFESNWESDDLISSPDSPKTDFQNGTTEWTGMVTTSDDCSYTSDSDMSTKKEHEYDGTPFQFTEFYPENPSIKEFYQTQKQSFNYSCSDRVSCTIWEDGELKKINLSVLDIAFAIISRTETFPQDNITSVISGIIMAANMAILPIFFRLDFSIFYSMFESILLPTCLISYEFYTIDMVDDIKYAFFSPFKLSVETYLICSAAFIRFSLLASLFFLFAVAERTFSHRFINAKLFSHLTSSRRAKSSCLPHFRLNKVKNIKMWLSVRSYLKKRGPQRSIDCIVSLAFFITLILICYLCMELLKDQDMEIYTYINCETVCWCFFLGIYLLKFMTLGAQINKKYKNLSVLLTEQINIYLQMEQKPHKKEALMLVNNVLKLAADLLKELEQPFKISGLSANSGLHNITKFVVLSALSGVLSEMLGFKLKLANLAKIKY